MPPMMAGMMRLINQRVMVVAIIAIGLGAKPVKKSAATFPRKPKSIKAIFIGLMVCTKKMAATKIIAVSKDSSKPKKDNNSTNCRQ